MDFFKNILQGLVDGSHPLPAPHPQRLNFPNNPVAIESVALMTATLLARNDLELGEGEVRHLLFKAASWCRRRGAVEEASIYTEMVRVWPDVEMALVGSPKWLTSRAGISWTVRRNEQLRRELYFAARRNYVEPPRVAEVHRLGFYLVELTNAAHVHREGEAMGHCMSWSTNLQVLQKGNSAGGDDALSALTYAVKVRSGELRLFSVRSPKGCPVLTIAYDPKEKAIVIMERRKGSRVVGGHRFSAAAIWAVGDVVPVKIVLGKVVSNGDGIRRDRAVVSSCRPKPFRRCSQTI